jgi:putative endopeptidase
MRRHTRKKKRLGIHPVIQLKKSVKPGDNFYDYVNGIWQADASISPIHNSVGTSQDLQDKVDECIIHTIDNLHKHKHSQKDNDKRDNLLLALYDSVKEFPHTHENIAALQLKISEIQCLRSKSEIIAYLGKMCRLSIPNILEFSEGEDPVNTRRLYWNLDLGDYSLADTQFYRNENYGSAGFWKEYDNYVRDLEIFWRLPTEDKHSSLHVIPGLEKKFDSEFIEAYEKENHGRTTNRVYTGAELAKHFPSFPWHDFWIGVGCFSPAEWSHKKIILRGHSLIRCLTKWLDELPLETWKSWLTLMMLNHGIQFATPQLSETWHQLFEREIAALPKRKTGDHLYLAILKQYASIALNDLFRDKCYSRRQKEEIAPLFKKLVSSALEQIDCADWMNHKTREHAKRKVRKMGICIGFPEGSYQYNYPYLSDKCLLDNIYALSERNFEFLAKQISKPAFRKVWTKPVFNVNAHYSENMNRIIFPAAILHPPFYVPDGSIGWNFGGIGATVGHEITHAFDRDGMKVNEYGLKKEWYSGDDKKEYDKRAEALVDIFEKLRDHGEELDAPYIISEAIADLGGLGIALHALQKELRAREADEEEVKKEMRLFFISYAYSWRIKMRRKQALRKVYTDEHPPAWTRVNYIVTHFQEFYDTFDVCKDDKLFLEPTKRIRFF